MLKQVKEWFEKTKRLKTIENDWKVESIELSKAELDEKLLPKEMKQHIPENVTVEYYYCELDSGYYVVYVIPLMTEKMFQFGLLFDNQLLAAEMIHGNGVNK